MLGYFVFKYKFWKSIPSSYWSSKARLKSAIDGSFPNMNFSAESFGNHICSILSRHGKMWFHASSISDWDASRPLIPLIKYFRNMNWCAPILILEWCQCKYASILACYSILWDGYQFSGKFLLWHIYFIMAWLSKSVNLPSLSDKNGTRPSGLIFIISGLLCYPLARLTLFILNGPSLEPLMVARAMTALDGWEATAMYKFSIKL